ncbi:YraN family protein [Candidatus Parcubacteria bacterium]|nr:YraN family protein [Candidatus Parcubacteria bacterium]
MPQTQKQFIGRHGEEAAAAFLRRLGYRIIETNWRPRRGRGELDLIASHRGALVFVEVKTRHAAVTPFPAEANITPTKIRHLQQLAARYLLEHPVWQSGPAQIDVIAVEFTEGRAPVIRHWPRAVGAPR